MARTGPECGPEGLALLLWSLVAPNAFEQRHNWMREMILEGRYGGRVCFSRKGMHGFWEEKGTGVSLLTDFASSSSANNCISISDFLKASQQNQFNYSVHKV